MLSLKERIDLLQADLEAQPMRISAYRDLPFAILRYDPHEEWELRRRVRLLATRLQDSGKIVETISFADLLWEVIDDAEGVDAVADMERHFGFPAAQEMITRWLSSPDYLMLPDALARRMTPLDPQRHVVFLMRAAAMAPAIYHMSKLLAEMQGRTEVPTILFYPGTQEGPTGLRFMAQKTHEALGRYHVKIYG